MERSVLLNLNIDRLYHMCIYFEPLQSVKAQEEYKRLVMQLKERSTESNKNTNSSNK